MGRHATFSAMVACLLLLYSVMGCSTTAYNAATTGGYYHSLLPHVLPSPVGSAGVSLAIDIVVFNDVDYTPIQEGRIVRKKESITTTTDGDDSTLHDQSVGNMMGKYEIHQSTRTRSYPPSYTADFYKKSYKKCTLHVNMSNPSTMVNFWRRHYNTCLGGGYDPKI